MIRHRRSDQVLISLGAGFPHPISIVRNEIINILKRLVHCFRRSEMKMMIMFLPSSTLLRSTLQGHAGYILYFQDIAWWIKSVIYCSELTLPRFRCVLCKSETSIRTISPAGYSVMKQFCRAHCIFHQLKDIHRWNVSFADLKQTLLFFARECTVNIQNTPEAFVFLLPSHRRAGCELHHLRW